MTVCKDCGSNIVGHVYYGPRCLPCHTRQAKIDAGICAYGNCQNNVTGEYLYCDECRDNL
jgi:hypothetical protein